MEESKGRDGVDVVGGVGVLLLHGVGVPLVLRVLGVGLSRHVTPQLDQHVAWKLIFPISLTRKLSIINKLLHRYRYYM